MHAEAHHTLRNLVVEYGPSLFEDPRRCEALLKDHCGQYKREIAVLVGALKAQVPQQLLNAASAIPPRALHFRLSRRVYDELGIAAEFADWAVDCWMLALGLTADPLSMPGGPPAPANAAEAALEALYLAAEGGDADAQERLGTLYHYGRRVPLDEAQAAHWYRRAADQGHARGQYRLGSLYRDGCGLTQDPAQAAHWYRRAADQGDPDGQYCLGMLYEHGRGLALDAAQATHWYRQAGAQGHVDAQLALGWLYQLGQGVPQDLAQAAHWYRQAADQGDPDGQYCLGRLYADGRGVPRDEAQALDWYRKAAAQGHAHGQRRLGAPCPTETLSPSP